MADGVDFGGAVGRVCSEGFVVLEPDDPTRRTYRRVRVHHPASGRGKFFISADDREKRSELTTLTGRVLLFPFPFRSRQLTAVVVATANRGELTHATLTEDVELRRQAEEATYSS
jgi:hypothetical protein